MNTESLSAAHLVIFASPNGRDRWRLCRPEDVPEWLKDPLIIARMLRGEMCMRCDEPPNGSEWYVGLFPEDVLHIYAAQLQKQRSVH